MTYTSSVLGTVKHPINIIPEYLAAFNSKPKGVILSWLDSWKKSGKEWAWLVLEDLSKEVGWCRDTLHRHLKELLELGVIERQRAKRWATDRAYKYRLVTEELLRYVTKPEEKVQEESAASDTRKSDYQESEVRPSTVQKSDVIYLNQTLNQTLTQIDNVNARVDFFEKEVDQEELIELEVKVEEVEECVNRNWLNYEAALLELKRQIFNSGCNNPTGFFLKALRNGWGKNSAAVAQIQNFDFEPTPDILLSLANYYGADKLIKDFVRDEKLGYPFVWSVAIDEDKYFSRPWWEACRDMNQLHEAAVEV